MENTGRGRLATRREGVAGSDAGMNVAVVRGAIARIPHERRDSEGTVHLSFELRVRRSPDAPGELVPVSWAGGALEGCGLEPGGEVVVVGRVRQRFFRLGGATQSRTEIVAEQVLAVRQHAAVRRALARAAELLTT
jgi:hypothetical protein